MTREHGQYWVKVHYDTDDADPGRDEWEVAEFSGYGWWIQGHHANVGSDYFVEIADTPIYPPQQLLRG